MDRLALDRQAEADILAETLRHAQQFLLGLETRRAVAPEQEEQKVELAESGPGAIAALHQFLERHGDGLSGSAGPRYLGFVTGGSTPAGLAADWLVSTWDQNAANASGSCACAVELEAVALLRQLFGLPDSFAGAMVTGATMANFAGLAAGRQWCGLAAGIDIAEEGLAAAPPIRVYVGTPHASAVKALAMLGMGRASLRPVGTLPGREAIDIAALERALAQDQGVLKIVLGSACTVNTADFDDLRELGRLCREHGAWLHVDAAFGLFAACSPEYEHWVEGIAEADSIASDGHKWLNVPYD